MDVSWDIERLRRENVRPINLFSVIGYAENYGDLKGPVRYVPPVFGLLNQDFVLVPPFRVNGANIQGGHVISRAEFEEYVADERARHIPPYQAKEGHGLWFDEEMTLGYSPYEHIRQVLGAFSQGRLALAHSQFRAGRLNMAIRFAENAISATVEPYFTQAKELMVRAHRALGEENHAQFLEKQIAQRKTEVAKRKK